MKKNTMAAIGVLTGAFAVTSIGGFMLAENSVKGIKDISPSATTILYDDKGTEIGTIHAIEDRRPVKLSQVPQNLQNAFIATEDNRFYSHLGVDPKGIARALYANLTGGTVSEGGSTITQQLAKNAYLTQEQTFTRKIKEAVLAVWLEYKYSKKEILEMYLNQIYFGRGAYGVQVAAQTYFGKDVSELDLNECAMLAGIPKSPNYFSPLNNYQAAMNRKKVVLDQMQKYNYINSFEANELKTADLTLKKETPESKFANYFINYVTDKLVETYGHDAVFKTGLKVYTTLDSNMQKAGEAQIQSIYISRNGEVAQPQGALVSIEPQTGKIKAMVGGRGTDSFNRATMAERQPGSSFKPFVFITALEQGYTPDSVISDGPLTIGGWSPQNYGRNFHGNVSMRQIAINSFNVSTVRLAQQVGIENVIENAKKLGITSFTPEDTNLVISIGGLTHGIIPLEMCSAYATYANNGLRKSPICFDKVTDVYGKELPLPEQTSEQVVSENSAKLLTSMLQDVVSRGTGTGANIGKEAAGKTGTTDNYRDAWFCGYTPTLATVVWLGNDDGVSLPGITGGNLPATLWKKYMLSIDSGNVKFEKPEYKPETANVPQESSKEEKAPSQQQNSYKEEVKQEQTHSHTEHTQVRESAPAERPAPPAPKKQAPAPKMEVLTPNEDVRKR